MLKISIVTPSYNQGKFIEAAIKSVLLQGYENFEHIIVDNMSTDSTKHILNKYPHIILISEPDKGQSDALNKGFKMATGDIIGWLNADDEYLPGCFKTVTNYCLNHSDIDVIYGDYRWIDEEGKLLQLRKELGFNFFMLKYLHVLYIPTTATFFKRKIFQEGQYLDIYLKYAMDYEFLLRLALKRYNFAHISAYFADFRWHKDSKSSKYFKAQAEEQKIALLRHDKFLQKTPFPLRLITRNFLQCVARCERYLLKFIKGYYFKQWQK